MKIARSSAKTSADASGAIKPPSETPTPGDMAAARPAMRWPIRDGWSTVFGTAATAGVAFAVMGVCAVVGASLAPTSGSLGDPLVTASAASAAAPLSYTAPAPSGLAATDLGLATLGPTAPAPLTALMDDAPIGAELFGDAAN